MKKTYAVWDKTQDQQNKLAKSGHSNVQTTYNHSGHKAETNTIVQKESKASVALFVKKAEDAKKMKSDAKINNIDEELDDLTLAGSVISAICSMEDIPADSWNIWMESNKYGAGLANINHIDTDCINRIQNNRSIKNIKELKKWLKTTLAHKLNTPTNYLIFLIMWDIPVNKRLPNILRYYMELLFYQ